MNIFQVKTTSWNFLDLILSLKNLFDKKVEGQRGQTQSRGSRIEFWLCSGGNSSARKWKKVKE